MDDLHFNIQDSIFFNYYYRNVDLKDWHEFESIDIVSGIRVLQRYTIQTNDVFRGINRRISRLFFDDIIEDSKYRITLEYSLNNKRISSKEDAFKLATLESLDDIIIEISELRDTCKVNIIFRQMWGL